GRMHGITVGGRGGALDTDRVVQAGLLIAINVNRDGSIRSRTDWNDHFVRGSGVDYTRKHCSSVFNDDGPGPEVRIDHRILEEQRSSRGDVDVLEVVGPPTNGA